jgi:hypothetical protein
VYFLIRLSNSFLSDRGFVCFGDRILLLFQELQFGENLGVRNLLVL